jgi:hypothetical protein
MTNKRRNDANFILKNNLAYGDSLDVFNINKTNCISKDVFEKIDYGNYDIAEKLTIKQKIE